MFAATPRQLLPAPFVPRAAPRPEKSQSGIEQLPRRVVSTGGRGCDVPAHDEIALLEAAKSGDSRSVRRLREALEEAIRRYVHRLVGPGEREEIVQDAFVALYMNLERIEPPENLRPFLLRIVRTL